MAGNAQASRNGMLRYEANLLFCQPAAPENRARAVVGGLVFAVRAYVVIVIRPLENLDFLSAAVKFPCFVLASLIVPNHEQ
jgi:hypothetical protein